MSGEPERRTLVLRSALDLCLLSLVAHGPVYGYELTARLAERGLAVAEGSAYPLLARLERAGLLASEIRTEGARPRRYYSITAAGRHALSVGREEWVATSDAVRAALLDSDVHQRSAEGAAGADRAALRATDDTLEASRAR